MRFPCGSRSSAADPGGLYFSILMRKIAPDCAITVFERNRAGDAFGFGVVFSDETLTVFEHADPESYAAIAERFARWTDIDIHHRGSVTRSGGHGFSALGRRELLGILQERARRSASSCGSSARRRRWPSSEWADLIVGADGASSAIRRARRPTSSARRSTRGTAATCGWAPTSCSTRSSSSSRRRRTGSSRPTRIPTTTG